MASFRMKCRHRDCGHEFHKHMTNEQFEKIQYESMGRGHACYDCGESRMMVIRSKKIVKDGFVPGEYKFPGNKKVYCATYGQYKALNRSHGLIEIGYDEISETKEFGETNFWSDENVMKMVEESGMGIDDGVVRELKAFDKGKDTNTTHFTELKGDLADIAGNVDSKEDTGLASRIAEQENRRHERQRDLVSKRERGNIRDFRCRSK